jgi:succinate dehydrogenase / fumarate reductase cytochrome b subunit
VVDSWFIKLVLFGLLWAYLHHFCAGIRFLLLDLHKGLELEEARKSSKIVLVVSLTLTLIIGVVLW